MTTHDPKRPTTTSIIGPADWPRVFRQAETNRERATLLRQRVDTLERAIVRALDAMDEGLITYATEILRAAMPSEEE